ncbi:DNA-binding response regulator [Halobacillus halophilus]|uniref:Two-component response regulator n=1 Tax=Halobacillus halophilus (strain ATCC 35676 / DSM 2266 / JCM 20832 / KCTC 3685 / LMG 17431 / NBRC 102448 / NCIMB 2269) TaxID=866895 RepID=I0JPI2_HALH3|nr:response regulator transcription factor [Halobacillus halophilus]ASF40089.1 DNA-binding response regulator [Halobacillus halophilus]CCG46052.1 two-component response regulator [Halobacillus halophilus DSM 2266]
MTRVLIVDDHPAVGAGTKAMLEQESDMKVDVIDHWDKVEDLLEQYLYDILLLDLYMPGMNGIELAKQIRKHYPDLTLLIYTGFDLSTHFNMLVEANINGFVSKTAASEQLVTAIRCALRDEVVIPLHLFKQLRRSEASVSQTNESQEGSGLSLNEKEQSILKEVASGFTNREIAQALHMSQRSVEYTLTGIFNKLNVRSRTEALFKAQELGLVSKS